jgi:MFS family permease
MILDQIALLVGLFAVPLLALRIGNRFRDQTPSRRRIFWGAVLGHSFGMMVTVCAALFPPIWWEGGTVLRDYLVHWSMLIGSIVGVVAARLGRKDQGSGIKDQGYARK